MEMKGQKSRLLKQGKMSKIVYGLFSSKAILGPVEMVAHQLQSENTNARSALDYFLFKVHVFKIEIRLIS